MRTCSLLATLAVLAGACSPGPVDSSTLPSPLPTTAPSTPFSPTTPAPLGTTSTTEPTADAAVLAAIVLFPGDLPEIYRSLPLNPTGSGFRSAGASLSSALEPTDEADDIVRFGLLGDFTITYGSTAGLWVAVEAVAFADPAGAGGYLLDWQEDLARAVDDGAGDSDLISFEPSPDETKADEAVRAGYDLAGDDPGSADLHGAVRVMRAGAILAWVWAVGEAPSSTIDDLGPLVESRLLAVLRGELPTRDPASLGLASPPTTHLDSFAFAYSYGIETTVPGGGFSIDVAGEFRSPDRTTCRVTYTTSGEQAVLAELVVIGTRVWLGGRTGYQEVPLRHPSALAELPLCPGHPLFWEDTGYHRLPEIAGTLANLDGLAVLRFDLTGDQTALAALGYSAARAARVTRYEVARVADGGWPVEIDAAEETNLAEARRLFGLTAQPGWAEAPSTIFTRLRLSRVDDPSITVVAPLAAG